MLSQKVKKDYIFNIIDFPGKDTACPICGISSFSHLHRKGSLPKDFERVVKQPNLEEELKERGLVRYVPIEDTEVEMVELSDIISFLEER